MSASHRGMHQKNKMFVGREVDGEMGRNTME